MKKIVSIIALLALSAPVLAGMPIPNPPTSGGGGSSLVSHGGAGQLQDVGQGSAQTCDDTYTNYRDFIALDQFNTISMGSANSIFVTYDDTRRTASINFPRYMKNCMELEFYVRKDEKGDYLLAARNKFFDGKAKYSSGDYADLGAQAKYRKCLDEEGVLPENSNNPNDYDYSKIEYASPSSLDMNIQLKEGDELTNLYFASSNDMLQSGEASILNGDSIPEHSNNCFKAENISESGLKIFRSGEQQRAYEQFQREVNCTNCGFDALYESYVELRSATGNASSLDRWMVDDLKVALEEKLKDMVDARCEEIKTKLAELARKIKQAKNREEAEPFVEEYADLLKELDEKYLTNFISRLEDRFDCKENLEIPKPEREVCKDEVEDIQKSIKELNDGHYFGTALLNKLLDFGLTTEAIAVKNFVLRSENYGKYDGRDKEKPLRDIRSDLNAFKLECEEAEREYLARNEGEVFSDIYRQQIERDQDALEGLNQQYARFIQETQEACSYSGFGYVNQTKCQRNQEKAQEVAVAYREEVERLTARINKYGGVYDKYRGLELAYEDDQKDDDDDDGEGRSSVLDDLFSDSGSSTTVSRNSSYNFSGTGNNSAMYSTANQQSAYTSSLYNPYSTSSGMGLNLGYNTGYNTGYYPYSTGYSSGYNPYYMNSAGISAGLNLGYNTGYNTGYYPYSTGYSAGFYPSYSTGYAGTGYTGTTYTPTTTTTGATSGTTYTLPSGF